MRIALSMIAHVATGAVIGVTIAGVILLTIHAVEMPVVAPLATLDAGTDGPRSLLARQPLDRWAREAVAIECGPGLGYNALCELQSPPRGQP